jgi:hypothetical protein
MNHFSDTIPGHGHDAYPLAAIRFPISVIRYPLAPEAISPFINFLEIYHSIW